VTESTGKGRPTPKRSETQRRRTGPVAPPPATRREAASRLRAQQAEQRGRLRKGTETGDEANMLPRDAGPVRRTVRDVVDGRRNLGILLLPAALLLVIGDFLGPRTVFFSIVFALWTATVLGVAFDLVVTALKIRSSLRQDFPKADQLPKHIMYGLFRSTVFRRFRMPPARVRPGRPFGRSA
jgi:hypothetical protein